MWCRNRIHCDPLEVHFRKSLATGEKLGVPAGDRVQEPPHLACVPEVLPAGQLPHHIERSVTGPGSEHVVSLAHHVPEDLHEVGF